MKKFMLFMMAIVGSVIGFAIISIFILDMSVGQYILIELVITALHWLYNKANEEVRQPDSDCVYSQPEVCSHKLGCGGVHEMWIQPQTAC